jgi:hypothetical protein
MIRVYKEYDIKHIWSDSLSSLRKLHAVLRRTPTCVVPCAAWSCRLGLPWWLGPCTVQWVPGVIPHRNYLVVYSEQLNFCIVVVAYACLWLLPARYGKHWTWAPNNFWNSMTLYKVCLRGLLRWSRNHFGNSSFFQFQKKLIFFPLKTDSNSSKPFGRAPSETEPKRSPTKRAIVSLYKF